MDYDHIMNEVAMQMAASQLSRHSRLSFGSTSKRWSGRVEKSRSTHTSPAIHERRRAHSTSRPVQPSIYQYPSYDAYSMPQHRPMRIGRPFSWHPTSQTLPVFNASQMTSPDTCNYIPTPPIPTTTADTYQYQSVPNLYPNIPALQKPSEPTPIMTASPVYSMDPYASNSPEWDYFYDGHTPVIANSIPPNSSPTYPGPWYDASCTQLPRFAQPMLHMPQLPPMVPQEKLSSMMQQHEQIQPILSAPIYPAVSQAEEIIKETQMEPQEEEGEVLVALGLYDLPDESAPIATGVAHLKLTETWQPPPEDEDSSQEEDEDDEEEVKTPGAGTSWFH